MFGKLARLTLESLEGYSPDELAVIQRFLERTREITARHAGELGRDAATTGRPGSRGR